MFVPLPLPTIESSVGALPPDRIYLGSVFADVYQILEHLAGRRAGLLFHPEVQLWSGFGNHLLHYARLLHDRLISLGPLLVIAQPFRSALDDVTVRADALYRSANPANFSDPLDVPPHWLGDPRLHAGHRSRLLTNHPALFRDIARDLEWSEPQHMPLYYPDPPSGPQSNPRPGPQPSPVPGGGIAFAAPSPTATSATKEA